MSAYWVKMSTLRPRSSGSSSRASRVWSLASCAGEIGATSPQHLLEDGHISATSANATRPRSPRAGSASRASSASTSDCSSSASGLEDRGLISSSDDPRIERGEEGTMGCAAASPPSLKACTLDSRRLKSITARPRKVAPARREVVVGRAIAVAGLHVAPEAIAGIGEGRARGWCAVDRRATRCVAVRRAQLVVEARVGRLDAVLDGLQMAIGEELLARPPRQRPCASRYDRVRWHRGRRAPRSPPPAYQRNTSMRRRRISRWASSSGRRRSPASTSREESRR